VACAVNGPSGVFMLSWDILQCFHGKLTRASAQFVLAETVDLKPKAVLKT